MHANTAQMMAMSNVFWPFSYPLKSYDLSLHPAFLHSAYRSLPSVQYGVQTNEHTSLEIERPTSRRTPTPKQKTFDAFSIEAILKRDKSATSSRSPCTVGAGTTYSESTVLETESETISRRHQRLLEGSHPYLNPRTSVADKPFIQKHLTASFTQYTDTVRADKCERKVNPSTDGWGKQNKGKRVRTIFTPEQLERMEAEFERQQYMVGTERYYLASSLNLTEAQVKVWFQNRRIKWRKQHLEQQQAKLKTIDIYQNADSASDSESDDDNYRNGDVSNNVQSFTDPFQSPKEARGSQ